MEHVVFYQSTQGTPAFRRVASLEDAVSFAEHLRNVEGVTDFSVFSLSPVTLSMRAYYHVEVSGADASAAPSAAPDAAPAAAAEPPPLPPAMPAAAPVADPTAATATAPDAPAPFDATSADAPRLPPPLDAPIPAPSMSFNALEQEASAPPEEMPPPMASVPFAAAPLPPPGAAGRVETFVKDDPAELAPSPADSAAEPTAVDPNVVDPTTEEVVPSVPTGRRSMGFFARS